jgi:DNA-directed RNA polymerase sigma subunit (sigma70/sigma32)
MARRPAKNLIDATRCHRSGPVEHALANEARERLKTSLDGLTDAELQIVTMRFGLGEHRPRSITFVAKVMRLKQAEAEAILAGALATLRRRLQ